MSSTRCPPVRRTRCCASACQRHAHCTPRIISTWELRHNLGAYDAAYIALAEALGCELLTGDVKLKNAAGHHATVIVTR